MLSKKSQVQRAFSNGRYTCFWNWDIKGNLRIRKLDWRIDHHDLVKVEIMLEIGMWGLDNVYNLLAKFHYKGVSTF